MYPSIKSWFTPAPNYFTGGAVFYGYGVMEANADVRELDLSNSSDGSGINVSRRYRITCLAKSTKS